MPALTLYEITELRARLDGQLDETDGELTPDLEAVLNQLDGQADEKIEHVGLYIRERLASAVAVRLERDRLDALMRREERVADSLKGYLLRNMVALGKPRVVGRLVTVAITRNSQPSVTTALDFPALYALPEAQRFVHREDKTVYALDRDAVLAAWKNHESIPDAIRVDLGSHIRIR